MAELYWPFPPDTVSEWPGTRPAGWAYHVGTDFAVAQGTPLKATMAGTAYLTWDDGYGAYVIDIVNPDGTVARHGHLSRMDVADGAWVNAGDHIGLTGGAASTPGAGLSTGAHLHWEIRNSRAWAGDGWFDPRNLTIRTFGESAATTDTATKKVAKRRSKNMLMAYCADAAGKGKGRWAVFGPNFWLEIETQESANALSGQLGVKAQVVGASAWAKYKRVSGQ